MVNEMQNADHVRCCAENEGGRALLAMDGSSADTVYYFAREAARYAALILDSEIRPYGPGKFNTILDSYVYSVSLDGGCDSEAGDCQSRWYGIMKNGRSIFRDHDPFLETLTLAEQEALTGCAGVILSECSQGFVHVEYYDDREKLETDWAEIEREAADDYGYSL